MVKRKSVNWVYALLSSQNPDVYVTFCEHLRDGCKLSNNRIAYYVLKSYYSTTTLAYYRQFGLWPWDDELLQKMKSIMEDYKELMR